MTEAENRLREAIRIEAAERKTEDADRCRYGQAFQKLNEAANLGGGFGDALAIWIQNIEQDKVISLLSNADPSNRAALIEVLTGFRRFGKVGAAQ